MGMWGPKFPTFLQFHRVISNITCHFLGFVVQGKTTFCLDATLSGLLVPPPSSHHFTPDALLITTIPIYPGLGQALSILGCIPNGLVIYLPIVPIFVCIAYFNLLSLGNQNEGDLDFYLDSFHISLMSFVTLLCMFAMVYWTGEIFLFANSELALASG